MFNLTIYQWTWCNTRKKLRLQHIWWYLNSVLIVEKSKFGAKNSAREWTVFFFREILHAYGTTPVVSTLCVLLTVCLIWLLNGIKCGNLQIYISKLSGSHLKALFMYHFVYSSVLLVYFCEGLMVYTTITL